MKLPSQDQVNAATRHLASFAGGAILMFGLGAKITPDTLTAIINATGNLVNDVITLVGIVAPLAAAYFAARSASQTAQVHAVQAMPGVEKVLVNAQASPALAVIAADPTQAKVVATPEAAPVVAATAKAAA